MPSAEDRIRAEISNAQSSSPKPVASMVIQNEKVIGVLNKDLIAICEANPDHPLSALKLNSIDGLPPDAETFHEVIDLQAIIDNRDLEVNEEIEVHPKTKERVRVRRKALIDFKGSAPKPNKQVRASRGVDTPVEPAK